MTTTAMKPWAELGSDRERDAAVAEFVLGQKPPERATYDQREKSWGHYRDVGGNGWWFESVWPQRYTTNAADDYRVLEFVRKAWDREKQTVFGVLIHATFSRRWRNPFPADETFMAAFYEPGDYSAAAYEAKRLAKGTE